MSYRVESETFTGTINKIFASPSGTKKISLIHNGLEIYRSFLYVVPCGNFYTENQNVAKLGDLKTEETEKNIVHEDPAAQVLLRYWIDNYF